MNTNELSFRELADVLAELGIAEVSQERIEELENVWEKCPEEVLDSLNKMAMLLTEVGHGNYDYTTWTWTPSSNKVYSFDMEAFDVSSMYEIFFRGIQTIGGEKMVFADVVQVDNEEDDGRIVTFRLNGNAYEFTARFGGDWYDMGILSYLNQILDEGGRKLYFMTDGYQEGIIFYCDAEWAAKFEEKTGCRLEAE